MAEIAINELAHSSFGDRSNIRRRRMTNARVQLDLVAAYGQTQLSVQNNLLTGRTYVFYDSAEDFREGRALIIC